MSTRRKGLGRGLDALLDPVATASEALPIQDLPLSELRPNRLQPRQSFDDADLGALAESIRTQGILQPILVAKSDQGYQIVAGERRWRAARLAGLERVPVRVVEVGGDRHLLELALVENLQRADLNPLEEAEAYQLLRDRFELSQDEIATRLGKGRTTITNALRLLRLEPAVQDLLRAGRLTAGQARPLLAVRPPSAQVALALEAVAASLSARELEARAAKSAGEGDRPELRDRAEPSPADLHTRSAEERLVRGLQTKVEIKRSRDGRGTIRLHFHSEEELMRLYDLLIRVGGDA